MTRECFLVAGVIAGVLVAGCGGPPGRRLCDAIATRNVAEVGKVLADQPLDLTKDYGTCIPVKAVFETAKAEDAALTAIGVELVKAGLPGDASWSAHGSRVWAIESAAGNGNLGLMKALLAVNLDVTSREAARALVAAAVAGRLSAVELLVKEGVEPEGRDDAESPLARAEAAGREDVARFLTATIEARAAAAVAAADKPD